MALRFVLDVVGTVSRHRQQSDIRNTAMLVSSTADIKGILQVSAVALYAVDLFSQKITAPSPTFGARPSFGNTMSLMC